MNVALYLRKSRADEDAERRGEGETLAKHKTALLKLAKQLKLNIIRIREEIVSGETLVHRPEMLQLLKEVESGEYDAVLVMEWKAVKEDGLPVQVWTAKASLNTLLTRLPGGKYLTFNQHRHLSIPLQECRSFL